MSKREITRKFDEIVAFAELEKFIDTPVKHYSTGMYVRLAFAVAAHLEPEILLVDEVLAVGDIVSRKNASAKWATSPAKAAPWSSSPTTWPPLTRFPLALSCCKMAGLLLTALLPKQVLATTRNL